MRRCMLIATLILAGSASAQTTAPAPRSRDEVLALPTIETARTLLGDIASRFVTMTVERNGGVPVGVAFATAPRATGMTGLCEATVLRIFLWREENRAVPADVRSYSVSDVYKVTGEFDGSFRWNEGNPARRCTGSGPVLPSPPDDPHAPRFFAYDGNFRLGLAALQGAIQEARRARYRPVECTRREPDDCRDPRAEFAALDLRNLMSLDVNQPDPEQPNFRLHARFVVEPGRGSSFGRQVSVEFNGEPFPGERMQAASFGYGRTRLYRY